MYWFALNHMVNGRTLLSKPTVKSSGSSQEPPLRKDTGSNEYTAENIQAENIIRRNNNYYSKK